MAQTEVSSHYGQCFISSLQHHRPVVRGGWCEVALSAALLPNLNPIEEFFAELKVFIKRNWEHYARLPQEDFGQFLEWCVDTVGVRKQSAEGHFRHAGVSIEEL